MMGYLHKHEDYIFFLFADITKDQNDRNKNINFYAYYFIHVFYTLHTHSFYCTRTVITRFLSRFLKNIDNSFKIINF